MHLSRRRKCGILKLRLDCGGRPTAPVGPDKPASIPAASAYPPESQGRARPPGAPPLPRFPPFRAFCQTPHSAHNGRGGTRHPGNISMGCFLSLEGRLPRRPGSFCTSLTGYSAIHEWVKCQALLVSDSGMRPRTADSTSKFWRPCAGYPPFALSADCRRTLQLPGRRKKRPGCFRHAWRTAVA